MSAGEQIRDGERHNRPLLPFKQAAALVCYQPDAEVGERKVHNRSRVCLDIYTYPIAVKCGALFYGRIESRCCSRQGWQTQLFEKGIVLLPRLLDVLRQGQQLGIDRLQIHFLFALGCVDIARDI